MREREWPTAASFIRGDKLLALWHVHRLGVELDISKCMSQQNDDGRLLRGTVVARKRREVKQGDKTRFCISIFVRWSEGVLPADRWSDKALPDDPPSVGQKVERPVSVGAYLTHGVAMARLTWGAANAGGDF